MYKPKDQKERTLHRYKIALGHLKKVVAMAEAGEYCIDVLFQSQAVQKALADADKLLLQNHLMTCVADAMRSGNTKKAVAEVMAVFENKK